VFPLSFAAALGLDTLTVPMQMTGGVGNPANPTHYADVQIKIPVSGGLHLNFDARVGFISDLAQGIGLLGQAGFFERFTVVFDHAAKLFHIDGEAT
jgi:hypothetical protein